MLKRMKKPCHPDRGRRFGGGVDGPAFRTLTPMPFLRLVIPTVARRSRAQWRDLRFNFG